jgi:hypothetical protein
VSAARRSLPTCAPWANSSAFCCSSDSSVLISGGSSPYWPSSHSRGWLKRAFRRIEAEEAAEARRRAAMAARADQQHAWVLQGDERGVYGQYSAAL